ncbi:MAG: hypothetical protein ABIW02_03310 [Nitrosospira sp.]
MSDHADWPGLMQAIKATGAPRVIVTHGHIDIMVRWGKATPNCPDETVTAILNRDGRLSRMAV